MLGLHEGSLQGWTASDTQSSSNPVGRHGRGGRDRPGSLLQQLQHLLWNVAAATAFV